MKKLYVAATLACLSTTAFANTIVPEISRDGKTKNDSVIATSNQMRTFVAAEYNSNNREFDAGQELDTTNFDFYGAWANKMLTIEADLDLNNLDVKGIGDSDTTIYEVQLGYRINDKFALGVGYQGDDPDGGNTGQDIEIAGAFTMSNMILGLSYTIQDEDTDSDGSNGLITLGVGSNANNMSWEAGLKLRLEDEDSGVGSRTNIFGGFTKVINNMELDGDIYYETGDKNYAGGDYSEYMVKLDVEILMQKQFYVTPGLEYMSVDDDGTDSSQLDLSVDLGYRANKIDATFGIDYALTGESNNNDYDEMAWKINVAYLF